MRVLFLGLGGVGQRHLRNLRHLVPDASVAAIRAKGRVFEIRNDLSVDESVDMVDKYGVEILPDLTAGLAWTPDMAVVATPSALHVDHCLPLIEAGIAVLVEKPAATDGAGYDRLQDAAARRNVPVMVAYQQRFNPLVRRFREVLGQSRIGRIQSIEVTVHSHMPSWHAYEKPNEFYAGQAALGGGVVMTEIHELDLLGWMFGDASDVAATGGRLGDYDIDVEDTIAAVARFTLDGRAVPAAISLSFVQQPPARRFVVNGTLGRVTMELPKLTITVEDETGTADVTTLPDFDRNQLFIAELDHFLACVREQSEPSASLGSCRAGQRLAEEMLGQVRKGMGS